MQEVLWFVSAPLGASQHMMDRLRCPCANQHAGFASPVTSFRDDFAGLDQRPIGPPALFDGGAFDGFLGPLDRRPF